MYIRFSREYDKEDIEYLLKLSFSRRLNSGELDNILGRYLLAFEDEKLIGMSGLIWSEKYKAFKIDWTCVHPEYRNHGIATELLSRLVGLTDEAVYCSCWRTEKFIHLKGVMESLNFHETLVNENTYKVGVNCSYNGMCSAQDKIINKRLCQCSKDLWVRQAKLEGTRNEFKAHRLQERVQ